MKFSIKKEILLENLNYVSHAVSTKNVIPVLSGIKFDLKEDGLYLISSDNEVDIEVFIDKKYIDKIEKTGSIVIQGKFLLDIVRKLPDGEINIEVVDGLKIMLYNENSNFNLNGIDPDEFPNLNIEKSTNPITLDKKVLKTMVNQTIYATSTQESRPILTGLNFKIDNDTLECIATDSYRLAKKTIKLDKAVDNPINIVIPGKNIGELVKIINDEDEKINIHIFTNKVLFEFDNILFQSRLLNDVFPNISRLIPSEFKLIVKADLNELFNVVDRASLLTSEKEKNVIKFETNGNVLIVTSNTPEIGRVEEKLSISKDNEEDIKIAFSAKHMMDALRTINSKDVRLLLNSEISPIILNTEDSDDLLQLLMPIKTY